ncbi:MAG: hypothetical protein HC830_10315 [Bacteroidetes bacterium]|nr:hypothetical protein [Bacteroidota bacterium]
MKNLVIAMGMISIALCASGQEKLPELKWELGYAKSRNDAPVKYIPAVIPGAVQLDIARSEKYDPHFYAENWKDYLWMEDQFYIYRTLFNKPQLEEDQRLFFISRGIDYQFEIFINDEKILEQEGMFTWVTLDLTDKLKARNELKIFIYPVPKMVATPVDRIQAAHVAKPPVSYGGTGTRASFRWVYGMIHILRFEIIPISKVRL